MQLRLPVQLSILSSWRCTAMTSESTGVVAVNKNQQEHKIETKVYKRRWLMLGLFILNLTTIAGQWLQYSIISNIISRYYNVSSSMVDWMSMVTMLFYVVFIIPLTYISEKIGLRWSVIVSSALAFLGSWIKVTATYPDRFYTALLGQSIISVAWAMTIPWSCRVSAQWFSSDELSTATSLAYFGNQLGDCLTFILTPVLVKNHVNIDDIGPELHRLILSFAVAATINLVLCILFFQEEPRIPPNEARALQKVSREQANGYLEVMKSLLYNPSFLMLFNSHGLNFGVMNAFATLLNQLFLIHFKNGEEDVGRIGLIMIITGIISSITFGLILDKTKKFKYTIVTAYFFTTCSQIFFAVATIMEHLWVVYASVIVVGIFLYGTPMIGYELSVEYTYPESEVHSSAILNISNNLYGMILILVLQQVLDRYGDVAVHVIFCVLLFASFIMTVLTKDEHRRLDAKKTALRQNLLLNRDDNNA